MKEETYLRILSAIRDSCHNIIEQTYILEIEALKNNKIDMNKTDIEDLFCDLETFLNNLK